MHDRHATPRPVHQSIRIDRLDQQWELKSGPLAHRVLDGIRKKRRGRGNPFLFAQVVQGFLAVEARYGPRLGLRKQKPRRQQIPVLFNEQAARIEGGQQDGLLTDLARYLDQELRGVLRGLDSKSHSNRPAQ